MTKMPEPVNLQASLRPNFRGFILGRVDLVACMTFMPLVRQFIIVGDTG